jgi:signal transduction histidine kinase
MRKAAAEAGPISTITHGGSNSVREPVASVWIVDDSSVQRASSARALAGTYEVSTYEGGAAVLESLAAGPPLPDVLVLDWHMPDLTGIEICKYIRLTKDRVQLPILMLTGVGADDGAIEALSAGANDFVTVPVSPPELAARISVLVQVASLHARLAEAERQLRVEADFRERFMGMLAHDLRQPLNAIFMTSQTLSSAVALPPNSAPLIEVQLRSVRRMKRMIDELLDFTRIRPETGMPIERARTDLAAIVRSCVSEVLLNHPEQQLELDIESSCEGNWDADRLAQVCSNLLNNAVEHSPSGSRIAVELRSNSGQAELRVTNHGVTIPSGIVSTLFQAYRRGPGKRDRDGVGLGLYIVDQIVRAHEGSISVQTEAGITQFVVFLPRDPRAH